MRDVTAYLTLAIPLIIAGYCLYDACIWCWWGDEPTITRVVRSWADKSSWPEFVYLVLVIGLYAHLFRKWPL